MATVLILRWRGSKLVMCSSRKSFKVRCCHTQADARQVSRAYYFPSCEITRGRSTRQFSCCQPTELVWLDFFAHSFGCSFGCCALQSNCNAQCNCNAQLRYVKHLYCVAHMFSSLPCGPTGHARAEHLCRQRSARKSHVRVWKRYQRRVHAKT